MRIPEWSRYQELPIGASGAERLSDSDKVTLLKKLGINACNEKARSSFLISRRLKG